MGAQVEYLALWEPALTFMGVGFSHALPSLRSWGRTQEKYYWGYLFCFIFLIILLLLLFCIPGNIFHFVT